MPARLTVYCTRSVDHVTAADLKAAVDETDVHTDAEVWGIEDEAVVDEALSHLNIELVTEPDGPRFSIQYAAGEARPVLIELSGRVAADEMLDEMRDVTTKGVARVRQCLRDTVQEVELTLGWHQLDDMGIVFASRFAETFASAGGGLIHDQNDEWWAVEDDVPTLVLGRCGDA